MSERIPIICSPAAHGGSCANITATWGIVRRSMKIIDITKSIFNFRVACFCSVRHYPGATRKLVAEARFELATFGLWAQRANHCCHSSISMHQFKRYWCILQTWITAPMSCVCSWIAIPSHASYYFRRPSLKGFLSLI